MATGRYSAVSTLRFFSTTIILAVAALVTGWALGLLPRCFRSPGRLCPESSVRLASLRMIAVVVRMNGRVLPLPRCFRSLGKTPLPASPGAARRRTDVVGALDFARCYRSFRALSPSRPPLLEDNTRRCAGFPGKSGHCGILCGLDVTYGSGLCKNADV